MRLLRVYFRIYKCICVCIPSILIIHRFHLCKRAYVLKFTHNPKINMVLLWSFVDMRISRTVKSLMLPLMHTPRFPAQVEQGDPLPSYFSSHTANRYPLCSVFGATLFSFLCFLLLILLFQMSSE